MKIFLDSKNPFSYKGVASHPEWQRDWPEEATATPRRAGCQLLPQTTGALHALGLAGRDGKGTTTIKAPSHRYDGKGLCVRARGEKTERTWEGILLG